MSRLTVGRHAIPGLRRGLLLALLCLTVLMGVAVEQAQAQSAARNLTIDVSDANENESIVLTLTLSSAPGNVSAAERAFKVSTAVPSSWDLITCISSSFGCTSGERTRHRVGLHGHEHIGRVRRKRHGNDRLHSHRQG